MTAFDPDYQMGELGEQRARVDTWRCSSCGSAIAPVYRHGKKAVLILGGTVIYQAMLTEAPCCGAKAHFHSRPVVANKDSVC